MDYKQKGLKQFIRPRIRLVLALSAFSRILATYYLLKLLPRKVRRRVSRWIDERNARKLLKRLLLLKGLFIKVGQFLSVRADLLPRPYIKHLSTLQDSVPPSPFELIRKRIEDELGPIDAIFSEFTHSAVAAASLGQVHSAVLKDGRKVAVKVQYPEIDELVRCDLNIMRIILKILKRLRHDLDTGKILKEFESYVSQELDYINEGKNAERIAENFKGEDWLLVPKVIWECTTKRVLTLEFVEGTKITNVEEFERGGIPRKEAFRKVLDMYFKQIFKHGFFQADPHPGNIFIRYEKAPEPTVVLLDFGLCKSLPPTFKSGLAKIAISIIQREPEGMATAMQELGFISKDGTREGFLRFSHLVIEHAQDIYKNPKDIDFQGIINQIAEIAREHPLVEMPTEFILLGRTLGLLVGLARTMKTGVRVEKLVMPYIMG